MGFCSASEAVEQFLTSPRSGSGLQKGDDVEKKKALLRDVVERGVFDGELLALYPAYEKLTGIKMASPRGFEPRSPP